MENGTEPLDDALDGVKIDLVFFVGVGVVEP